MKRLYLAALLIAGFASRLPAQVPTEKTLLWQVTGKGIKGPSYLFGTIHLMCPSDMKIPEMVKEKFAATSELYLEIDMDDPNMVKEMLSGIQMKDTATIEKLMGKQFDTANNVFRSATGMPLKMLNTAKPLLVMSMIYPSLLGCTPVSWESVFQKMAKDKGIEINGLEKFEDQINVFEQIPYKVQANMLLKMLLNIDSAKIDFQKMVDVYKKKDINELNILTAKEEEFDDYEEILLSRRNHNWIPVIGEQAKKKPTFFAFGAGHLGGETGIINLLRRAGFTVKPVLYQ